jgi:hypothetical protein
MSRGFAASSRPRLALVAAACATTNCSSGAASGPIQDASVAESTTDFVRRDSGRRPSPDGSLDAEAADGAVVMTPRESSGTRLRAVFDTRSARREGPRKPLRPTGWESAVQVGSSAIRSIVQSKSHRAGDAALPVEDARDVPATHPRCSSRGRGPSRPAVTHGGRRGNGTLAATSNYGNFPNTPTPSTVPTYTWALATVGTTNLLPLPNVSLPAGA